MYNKLINKLVELSPKKFWAAFISILLTFILIETLLVASLIESLYIQAVSNKMYKYSYVDYELEKNTTYRFPLLIQDGYLVKREIHTVTQVYITSIDKDWTIFVINISINIAIEEGSIVVKSLLLTHQPSIDGRVYISQSISTINTTIDSWDWHTTTFFSVYFRTSDIAESLEGVYVPFWL